MVRFVSAGAVLRDVIRGHRRDLDLVVCSMLLMGHQAADALVPVMIGVVIDQAISGGDALPLVLWVTVLGGCPMLVDGVPWGDQFEERAAADLFTGLRVVKGLHAEAAAVGRYRSASRGSLRATLRSARVEGVHEGADGGVDRVVPPEDQLVTGANHSFSITHPAQVAELLAAFFPRPLPA